MKYLSAFPFWLVAALLLALARPTQAQQTEAMQQATALALQTRAEWAGTDLAAADFRISSAYTEGVGLLYAYPQQLRNGIPVYNQVATLVFKGGVLRHHAGPFLGAKAFAGQPATPTVAAAAAVAKALASAGAKPTETPAATSAASGVEQEQTFGPAGVARRPIVVRLVWATDQGTPRLAWNVNVDLLASPDWLNIRVDAATGAVLGQDNWTVNEAAHHPAAAPRRAAPGVARQPLARPQSRPAAPQKTQAVTPASYRVVPYPNERPDVTTPTTDTNPWLRAGAGNNAATYGWHYDGATDYLDTRGNNVWAYDDSLNRNTPGRFTASTGSGSSLVFNDVPDFTQVPTLGRNRRAATTNLFYWNNLMHDVLYQYGFTEAAGNFQTSNLSRGGLGNDYVKAEAQDGRGTNNANFATPNDGSNPRMQMYLFTLSTPKRDGDFDNGVIAHEYGHGISNRLAGGPANSSCLSNAEQGGEGWSDYFGLMMTTNWATARLTDGPAARAVGAYALGQSPTGAGFRRYPYSTSLSVNPLTYADMAGNPEVHDIGEIWCATLWDLTWALIQQQGTIEPNLYNSVSTGGNAIALNLVMQGLKMQPCQGGFLDARNAILAADNLLYGGQYRCLIKRVFARRGMGTSAVQGSARSTGDQIAAFDTDEITLRSYTTPQIGNRFTINLEATAGSCSTGGQTYTLTNQLPTGLQYLSSTGGTLGSNNTVTFANLAFAAGQTRTFQILAQSGPGAGCAYTIPLNDDRDANTAGGLTPGGTGANAWVASAVRPYSGTLSWRAPDATTTSDVSLISAPFTPGSFSSLSFYQYFNTEAAFDGGLVSLSTDGGTTWVDAAPYFQQNGYNSRFSAGTVSIGKPCFSGTSSPAAGAAAYAQTTLNLSAFSGQAVRVRFQFQTDLSNAGGPYTGWFLDDIQVLSGCGGLQQVRLVANGTAFLQGAYNTPTFLTPLPLPVISSLVPGSGGAGTSVTLTGLNLSLASSVTVNGVATTPTNVTATSLNFVVPAGASPTQSITVTTPIGTSAASPAFTVQLRVAGSSPAANALRAARPGSAVALTFSEPVTAGSVTTASSQVKVFSAQAGGRKIGSWAGGGTARIGFVGTQPGNVANFQPGEVVSVTVPVTVLSAGGLAAQKRVYQFTAGVGGTGGGNFVPGTNVGAGNGPAAVAVGDVDADGDLDMVAANYTAGTVSVVLNGGSGSYSGGSTVTVGSGPNGVVLADVDADGDLDLLTANVLSGTVTVVLNGGNGSGGGSGNFSNGSTVPVGGGAAYGLAVGDIDGDGDLDLVTANNLATPIVSVRLNNGGGTFGGSASVAVGSGPQGVALADVDGDGDLDVLSANTAAGTVSVVLNGGDATGSNTGTFTGGSTVPVGSSPHNVAVADVDGDGDLDLLTANDAASGTVSVVLNGGNGSGGGTGTFSNGSTVPVGANPRGLAVGDVDGDGDLDLLTTNTTAGTVSVRLNGGDASGSNTGTFSNGSNPATGGSPYAIALADADGDGDLDFFTANNLTSGTVSVRFNTVAPPTLTSLSPNPATWTIGASVVLTGNNFLGTTGISFNGTPALSFGVINPTRATATVPVGATSGNVTLTTGNGTSNGLAYTIVAPLLTTSLSPVRNFRTAPRGTNVDVVFNAALDASTAGNVRLYSSQRGGQLVRGGNATVPSANTLHIDPAADLQPGETVRLSIPAGVRGSSQAARPLVYQFTAAAGVGPGIFQTTPDVAFTGSPKNVALADMDGDGDLDMVTLDGSSYVEVRLNGGDASGSNTGTFSNGPTVAVGGSPSTLGIGDVDGDGDLDIMTAQSGGYTVALLLNGGDNSGTNQGLFVAGPSASVPSAGANPVYYIALGDVDGDGDLDLVAATLRTFSIRLNGGDGSGSNTGTFSNGQDFAGLSFQQSVALGDIDNDGDLDILSTSLLGGLSTYLNGGDASGSNTGQFGAGPSVALGAQQRNIALGDVDGDNDLDVVIGSTLLLNGGNGSGTGVGTFPGSTTVPGGASGLALADVDGDGDLDLLATNNGGTATVSLNNGSGSFGTASSYATGGSATWVAAGDVDGDGDLDFVTANGFSGATSASVLLNRVPPPTIGSFSPNPAGVNVPVTLTGTNLAGTTALTVNGAVATILGSTATSVTFRVPVGATATGTTTVTTGTGGSASSPAFVVLLPPGNALAFDGSDDVVSVPHSADFNLTSTLTLEAWVRTTYAGEQYITSKAEDAWFLALNGGGGQPGAASVYLNGVSGGGGGWLYGTSNVADGRWHHVAATYDAATLRLYVDGVEQNGRTVAGTLTTGGSPVLVGSRPAVPGANWHGRLDEVRIWNIARSNTDLQVGMTSVVDPTTPGLLAYYSFDAGIAATASTGANTSLTTLPDLAATPHPGTLTNFALTSGNTTSNWVESYALVVPTATAATGVTTTGFAATWTAPALGLVDNGYRLDVSLAADFSSAISGSPFAVASGTSRAFSSLAAGTYYYRVRADKTSVSGQGSPSNTVAVAVGCQVRAVTQNITVALDASGMASVTVKDIDNGSTASCGLASGGGLSISPSTFGCANLGDNIVTLTVVDTQGNTATAPATVTITDDLLPTALAQNVGVSVGANGRVYVAPTAVNNGSSDNCGLANVALSASTFGSCAASAALVFDGVNDYVSLPHQAAYNVPAALTLEAWVQTTNSGEQYITTKSDGAWYLAVNGGGSGAGRATFYLSGVSDTNGGWLVGNTTISDGNWHHVAASYDGGTLRLYVDGLLDVSRVATGGMATNSSPVIIGGRPSQPANGWNGSLDEVRIWSVARSTAEISLYRDKSLAGSTPGLLAYFNFNDGAGSATVASLGSVGSVGTLTNFATATAFVAPGQVPALGTGPQLVTLTVSDPAGNVSSTTATITVSIPTPTLSTWTGSLSTDWSDCHNWQYGLLPNALVSVLLPGGLPRYPVLAGGMAVHNLTIAPNASLNASPSFSLQVLGDWLNNGTATLGGGTVSFGGAAAATIGGSSATAFPALVVDKSTATLSLAQDVTVNASLMLTNGLVQTGSNKVVLAPTATIIETETSYLVGNLETTRPLNTAGTGNNFGGMGLTLTPSAASPALPGSTLVRRVTGSPATGAGSSTGIGRYFVVTPAVDANLNVTMVFGYFDHEVPGAFNEARLALYKSEATGLAGPWAYQPGTALNTAANTITKTGIASLSTWTLGSLDAPLPVELLRFAATATGANVQLNWRTASEKNSARFEVERSADGKQFARIGTVAGQGSKASPTDYAFLDERLPAAPLLLYYRLQLVNLDGTASYSPVWAVQVGKTATLFLYPNPARSNVQVLGASANAAIEVFDGVGRLVATATADADGAAHLNLPAELVSGVYVVRSGSLVQRLIVE